MATELTRAILDILQRREDFDFSLEMALPSDGRSRAVAPQLSQRMPTRRGRLGGHAWEQFELPMTASNATLLSLCNTGPVIRRRQLALIHDAQVFLNPETYSSPFRVWYKFMLPKLGHTAGTVATVSDFSRRQLERYRVVPEGKCEVIHNGCDHLDRITADPAALGRFRLSRGKFILAIGSLAPHKNLAMLMRAAARRPAGAPELVIAGGGDEGVFADAGLVPPKGVRFIGRISDEELKALYENAIMLAFPSLTEGFGLPPLEAMRCGCPVLATTGGAVPEVCGDAAILISSDDETEWTRAMSELADNEIKLAEMKAAGLKRASSFIWLKSAEKILSLLKGSEREGPE